jgi:hypothetical protein
MTLQEQAFIDPSINWYCETPEVWALEFLEKMGFDGLWVSSLTRSWQKGFSDNMSLPWTDYVEYVSRLRGHTKLPIIVDVDTLSSDPEVAVTIAQAYERAGATALVIEDKGPVKVNSLLSGVVLRSPEDMCKLLNKVRASVKTLKIYARTEYLYKVEDPEQVAAIGKRYYEAGAHGVVVHWTNKDNLQPLKDTLKILKGHGIPTGIIPQAFTPEAASGEFSGLTNFAILGNVVMSRVRELFQSTTKSDLLLQVPNFKPILERSQSYLKKTSQLIVLGGVPQKSTGKYLLDQDEVVNKFRKLAFDQNITNVVLANGSDSEVSHDKELIITNTIGEIDTLTQAMENNYSDYTIIAYADSLPEAFKNSLTKDSALFTTDNQFTGIIRVNTDKLRLALQEVSAESRIIDLITKLSLEVKIFDENEANNSTKLKVAG